jgi:hypothetical protein
MLSPGANTVISLVIAVARATCVVVFFVHVKYSSKLIMVFVLSGIFWLGVMFLLTMTDFTTRPVVTTGPPSQTAPAAAPEKAGSEGEHGKSAPAHE